MSTPQKLVDAMVMIAQAAVYYHESNSGGRFFNLDRAKEDAIKLLRCPGGCDMTQAIHGFADDVSIEKLTQEN